MPEPADVFLWVTGRSGKRYRFDSYDRYRWKMDLLYEGPKCVLVVVIADSGEVKTVFAEKVLKRKFLKSLPFPASGEELVGVMECPGEDQVRALSQDLKADPPPTP